MPSQGRDTSLYGTAAVFGIALILACYRRFWLVAGILTYWGRGALRPDPPLWPACSAWPGGCCFCVLFRSFSNWGRVRVLARHCESLWVPIGSSDIWLKFERKLEFQLVCDSDKRDQHWTLPANSAIPYEQIRKSGSGADLDPLEQLSQTNNHGRVTPTNPSLGRRAQLSSCRTGCKQAGPCEPASNNRG